MKQPSADAPGSILVIDPDGFAGQALVDDLQGHGFAPVHRVEPGLDVSGTAARTRPDVVLLNYQFGRPDDLLSCCSAKLAAPDVAVVVIGSAGPATKALRKWNADNGYIDAIVEKPIIAGHLNIVLRDLLARRQAERTQEARGRKLANLVPQGAIRVVDGGVSAEEELFEATVLFTDVRRSSQLVARTTPKEFFHLLNVSLSQQSAKVRSFDGAVVKYTGDGMLAIFRGMGRAHMAVRCATALADLGRQEPIPFGVGVTDGLVLAGLVGDADSVGHPRQYDVLGATVHLAARLCSLAAGGEVITTCTVLTASRVRIPSQPMGAVLVRGFDNAIDCVSLVPAGDQQTL